MKKILLFAALIAGLFGLNLQNTFAQAVTGVSLNKHTLNLSLYGSEQLVATVSPANAANKNVRWSSSLPSVISVDSTNGTVTAEHDGEATVYVKTEDGGFVDSCVVTCQVADAANIITFAFQGEAHKANIYENGKTVYAFLPYNADISSLTVSSYQISPGASVSPLPETVHDYSKPVVFVVTSPDGTVQSSWTVKVQRVSDVSQAERVDITFSTAPQKTMQDTVSWTEKGIRFHVNYPDSSGANYPPWAEVGKSTDLGLPAIGLYPAKLEFTLLDTNKVIVAASMYIFENCGAGCTRVGFFGDGSLEQTILENSRGYHFFNLDSVKARKGYFWSYESEFSGITFWVVDKNALNNRPPVANAGPDQVVYENDSVRLDGTASYDPDGDSLSFRWTSPAGITLSDSTGATPSFKAPASEIASTRTFMFILTVNDGRVNSEPDTVLITVKHKNNPPVALLVVDSATVNSGDTALIDGYYSYDPDGDSLSFHWRAEAGSGIVFLDSTAMNVRAVAPVVKQDTTFSVFLKVDDGVLYSETDTFYLTVLRPNQPPVANAGPDQTVFENDTVHLDGKKSYDPDGDPITYLWHAPDGIALSDSTSATPSFKAPASEIASTRYFSFTLTVNDGKAGSEPDTVVITVKHKNNAPVALFTVDTASVNEGDTASINGRNSYDPDGDSLSFHWSTDPGSGIRFFDSTAMDVRVGTPLVKRDTTFRIYLKVDDGLLYSEPDTFYLTVKTVNRAPVAAIVSTDELTYGVTLFENDTLWIDGSPSYDPDGDSLTYDWAIPKAFRFYHHDSVKVMIIAPEVKKPTDYQASLFVSDGMLRDEAKFTIKVLNRNSAPVANAGTSFSVLSGKTDELDGSQSYDPDGDSLLFTWFAPAGIALSDSHAVSPVFQAPQVTSRTVYVFKLVVSDGELTSDTSDVEVVVLPIEATLRVSAKVNDTLIPYAMRHITLYYKNPSNRWEMAEVLSYNANGETFYAIWEGEWMITVDPVGNKAGFVTTFYGDVTNWSDALSFSVQGGSETQVSIQCVPVKEPLDGSGVIDGEIYRDTVTEGVNRNTVSRLEGSRGGLVPAEGVAIFLHRSNDDALLASTRTDNKGAFSFENLPLGGYYLLVQLPGFDANTPWEVQVTESDTVVNDVNFVINEAGGNITDVAQTEDIPVKLYPNPARENLFVQVNEQDRGALLRIYDLTGHLLLSEQLQNRTTRIDISRLQKGFYLLRIDSRNKVVTHRFIRQ